MLTYDKHARLQTTEDIRNKIGEVDAEIERLTAYKEEVEAAVDALAALEAVLRRMNMLAREAAKPEGRRPGVLLEFEQCKQKADELAKLAVVDGKNVLHDHSGVDAVMETLSLRLG